MIINRNNCEEYFLLYADNELSNAERKIVEIFVDENPDLREEFCMYKLTVNSPDKEIKFLDKSLLMKEGPSFITKNNYEEIFVLYYDNELTSNQKEATQKFIAAHPELKIDFELIGKSKLSIDQSTVFPDKKQLYKKEKSGKIIPLVIWRSAAAAVLIGLGLWLSYPYFTSHEKTSPVTISKINPETKQEPLTKKSSGEKEEVKPPAFSVVNQKENIVLKERNINTQSGLKPKPKNENQIAENQQKINNPAFKEKIKNLNPEENIQTLAANALIKKIETSPEEIKNANTEILGKNLTKPMKTNVQNNNPETINYIKILPETNGNYVFYDVPARDFKRTKVGGFLKKVKRIVVRSNPITHIIEGNDEQVASRDL